MKNLAVIGTSLLVITSFSVPTTATAGDLQDCATAATLSPAHATVAMLDGRPKGSTGNIVRDTLRAAGGLLRAPLDFGDEMVDIWFVDPIDGTCHNQWPGN